MGQNLALLLNFPSLKSLKIKALRGGSETGEAIFESLQALHARSVQTQVISLYLNDARVRDLSPLQQLTSLSHLRNLKKIIIDEEKVDLSPLRGLIQNGLKILGPLELDDEDLELDDEDLELDEFGWDD